jgi:hypothetical protein
MAAKQFLAGLAVQALKVFNAQKSISGFSAEFTLKEKEVNGTPIVEISISSGNIRYTNVGFYQHFDDNGYPESNKSYPNNIFALTGPSESIDIELNEYYIVTSGNDRYLIRIEPVGGPGTPPDWPMKIYYWKVLEGPNL